MSASPHLGRAPLAVGFVGKGGSGKSTVAGTAARLLARRGHRVLAVDSDPMPGLAYALGAPVTDAALPDELTEEVDDDGRRYRLRGGVTPAAVIDDHAIGAPDGVRLLQFGKLRGHVSAIARSQHAFRAVVRDVPPGWHVVADLPGGTRQAFLGWLDYVRTVVIVVEPTPKSFLSGRRLARLATAAHPPERIVVLANKVVTPGEVERVRAATGLDVIAAAPADPGVADADRLGLAPLDHAPASPFVAAVQSFVDRLLEERL